MIVDVRKRSLHAVVVNVLVHPIVHVINKDAKEEKGEKKENVVVRDHKENVAVRDHKENVDSKDQKVTPAGTNVLNRL
jgi:hypothetical protein